MAVLGEKTTTGPLGSKEERKEEGKRPPQYLFIHTVRFWCILAIVLLHWAFELPGFYAISPWQQALLVQPFKFGTIGFFVISGFLVGDRLPSSDPAGYLRRRAKRLLPAWGFWFLAWVLYTSQRGFRQDYAAGVRITWRLVVATLYHAGGLGWLTTPLWFVPDFLLALACVVMLRRWMNDLRLGAAFLAISVFYGVNVFCGWLPSSHPQAPLAFVFYLWLGAWCGLRKDRVRAWAGARSTAWLAAGAVVAAAIALGESAVLIAHHGADFMNTLRLGNQIYSVVIVILLVRIQGRSWPAAVDVAETTYGIYLIHPFVIRLLVSLGLKVLAVTGHAPGQRLAVGMWVILGPAVYVISWRVTTMFGSSPRWGWIVGASRGGPRRSSAHGAVGQHAAPQVQEA